MYCKIYIYDLWYLISSYSYVTPGIESIEFGLIILGFLLSTLLFSYTPGMLKIPPDFIKLGFLVSFLSIIILFV